MSELKKQAASAARFVLKTVGTLRFRVEAVLPKKPVAKERLK